MPCCNPVANLGWMMGFEPTTPGITIRCSNQLSYTHQSCLASAMARPAGIEPATAGLEGRCSIQLSYGRPDLDCRIEHHFTNLHCSGRGRGIRTPDILLPKQARYQTALYPAGVPVPPSHHAMPRRPCIVCSRHFSVKHPYRQCRLCILCPDTGQPRITDKDTT